jgi:hypothetical protein
VPKPVGPGGPCPPPGRRALRMPRAMANRRGLDLERQLLCAQRQRRLTDSTGAFEMERMLAIAARDGADLFLWIRLRRAARTDIYYVMPTGRENDPEWEKWNPHGSWHRDGRLHHRALTRRFFRLSQGRNPTPNSRELITCSRAASHPMSRERSVYVATQLNSQRSWKFLPEF